MSSTKFQIYALVIAVFFGSAKGKYVDLQDKCMQICTNHGTTSTFNADTNTCVCHIIDNSVTLGPIGWKLLKRRSEKIGLILEVINDSIDTNAEENFKPSNVYSPNDSILQLNNLPLYSKRLFHPLKIHNPVIAAQVEKIRMRLRNKNYLLGMTAASSTDNNTQVPPEVSTYIPDEYSETDSPTSNTVQPKKEAYKYGN